MMFKKMKNQLQDNIDKLKKRKSQDSGRDALTAHEQKKKGKKAENRKKKNTGDKTIEDDGKQTFLKKKKKGTQGKGEKNTREDQSQMPTVTAHSTQSREDQMKMSTKWCDAISDKGVDQLVKEFKQINDQPEGAGSDKPENAEKSRRKDLPCVEESRVKLDKDEFIHANYIQGICTSNRFIMTQHPLPTTIDTFWKMIHKDRVDAVIMLNEITPDCPNYLPSAVGVARSFADVKVTLIEQAPLAPELPFIIYSKMAIQRKKEDGAKVDPKSDEYDKRKFKHFQWLNWPKNSVPEVTNGIEMMLTSIRNTNRPIVVHCTDGATRSGVVVLVEQLFESITMGQGNADTGDMLKKIRDQRQKAIGNEAQYVYAHRIVMHHYVSQNSMDLTQTLLIFIDDYDSLVRKHNKKIAEEEKPPQAE